MSSPLHVQQGTLRWGDRQVRLEEVRALVERCDWRGRAWLEVRGPDWLVPIGTDFGEQRRALRRALSHVAWSSDWSDGRFPHAAPDSLAAALLLVLVVAGVLLGLALGDGAGVVLALSGLALWASLLRQRVEVTARGLRLGPAWSARWAWEEVEEVRFVTRGPRTVVLARGPRGAAGAAVPTVLVPPLRARLWRLGALRIIEGAPDVLDARYGRRQRLAIAVPWAVILAGGAAAWWTPDPWLTLTVVLGASTALAAWTLAARERAQGWGTGALLYLTVAYGVILALLAAWGRGWL